MGALDTLSHCTGVAGNARQLAEAGIQLLYGTDLAHLDVPWGIDAQELQLMVYTAHGVRAQLDVLSAATARAGEHLGLAPLGQLIEGAPADLIGVRGNPLEQFKPLEYPDLVVVGGRDDRRARRALKCPARRSWPARPRCRRATRRRCRRSPAGMHWIFTSGRSLSG